MKVLSFQEFSLFGDGGGSRILRRLYAGHESQITSLAIKVVDGNPLKGNIDEIIIPALPQMKKWHKWYLRKFVTWLRVKLFLPQTLKRIRNAAGGISYDVLHIVDHGIFSRALCADLFISGKTLWVSFHDHFSINGSSFDNANQLWNRASRRLVISEEMGREYQRLFGAKHYETITDGITEEEISQPVENDQTTYIIYFSGLLHWDYLPLFESLADSLDILSKEGLKFKIILRGPQRVKFLDDRSFEIEYRPFTLDNKELKQELDNASILYLPIKFTLKDFYLYSLSTKMIGYLGAPGAILYHGPADSAAHNLLHSTRSAATCTSLQTNDMVVAIKKSIEEKKLLSSSAKKLAKERFSMNSIQKAFWQN